MAALALALVVGARVALLAAGQDPDSVETWNRIRGELAAEGLEAVSTQGSSEEALAGPDTVAAMTITRSPGGHAHIRVVTPTNAVVREVDIDTRGGRSASEVAIHAVELLHAALARPPSRPAPPAVTRRMTRPSWLETMVRATVAGPALSLGGALLDAPGPVGPLFVPTLALSYGFRQHDRPWAAVIRASTAGLGTRIVLERPDTRVSVRRVLAELELLALYESRVGLMPFVSVGGGACIFSDQADDPAAIRGAQGTHTTFLTSAGAGVFWPAWGRLGLWLEGRAIMAVPPPTLEVTDADVPLLGKPSLMLSLGLSAALM
jgi:hypothetical protein